METSKLTFKIKHQETRDPLDEFREANEKHQPYLNKYLLSISNKHKSILRKFLVDENNVQGGIDEFLGDDVPPSRQELVFEKIQKEYSVYYAQAIAQIQKERELIEWTHKEFGEDFFKVAESKIEKLFKEIESMMPDKEMLNEAKQNGINPALNIIKYGSNKTSKDFINSVFIYYMSKKQEGLLSWLMNIKS